MVAAVLRTALGPISRFFSKACRGFRHHVGLGGWSLMRPGTSRLFLSLFLLLPALGLAQVRTTGRVTGRITDVLGDPIVGAAVTATSVETGLEREAVSDANGDYLLPLLPVGHWTVAITAAGKQPQVYSLRLGIGESVPVHAVLAPGETMSEEVTIYAAATAMEQSQSQLNLDYRQTVEDLPIEDRNINLVARLAPQVSDNVQSGGTLSIAGAPTFDTTVLLDGAEISDPYYGTAPVLYLEDAIEEVQVLTSGIGARYGRFQGGIINAVTKSGSNRYEATVRWEFSRQSWNEKTPFGEEQSDELDESMQVTLGGFLLKDHLWFFAGYREEPSFARQWTTGYTNEPFVTKRTHERWSMKLRGAPASNHLIDVSHLEFDVTVDPYTEPFLIPGHLRALTGVFSMPREADSAIYQAVLTPTLSLELQVTQKEAGILAGGAPNGRDPFLDAATFEVFNNYWWDRSDVLRRDNETAAANLTYSLHTTKAGTHTIEGGYQYVKSITAGANKQSPTGYNLLAWNADFLGPPLPDGEPSFNLRNGFAERWTALPLAAVQEVENRALYLQDSVGLGKWHFVFGLRWDDYRGSGPLPEFNMEFDDLATRLAVAYAINDRWQVVGTWGEYVSRLNDNVVSNATRIGRAPSIDTEYTGPDRLGLTADEAQEVLRDDSQWQRVVGFRSPDLTTTYLADDITAPVATDRTLSLRHALPRHAGTVEITWVDRSFGDLLDDYVGEVCELDSPFSGPNGCPADNVTGIPDETGVPVDFVDTTVWANNPDAVREYTGLSVASDYQPSAKWRVGGNYTFSEITGNYEGEGENSPASGSAMGDYPRSRPEEAAAPLGRLDEDVRHRIRAWALYHLDLGRAGNLSLSGVYSYNSGRRWSKTALAPRADIPEYVSQGSTYTHFFEGRGTEQFDDFKRFDLGIRYEIPIWSDVTAWAKVSIINIFDYDQLLKFETTARAVNDGGNLRWQPAGTCSVDDQPSKDCTGFGRISDQSFYQRPREYFFTLGLSW